MKSDFGDGSSELPVVALPLLVMARAIPQVIYESSRRVSVITVTRSASWDFCACRNKKKSIARDKRDRVGFNLGKCAGARISLRILLRAVISCFSFFFFFFFYHHRLAREAPRACTGGLDRV